MVFFNFTSNVFKDPGLRWSIPFKLFITPCSERKYSSKFVIVVDSHRNSRVQDRRRRGQTSLRLPAGGRVAAESWAADPLSVIVGPVSDTSLRARRVAGTLSEINLPTVKKRAKVNQVRKERWSWRPISDVARSVCSCNLYIVLMLDLCCSGLRIRTRLSCFRCFRSKTSSIFVFIRVFKTW